MNDEELLKKIKENGLILYQNNIPKHVVCHNCGLERTLKTWLNEHGKKCTLPTLDRDSIT